MGHNFQRRFFSTNPPPPPQSPYSVQYTVPPPHRSAPEGFIEVSSDERYAEQKAYLLWTFLAFLATLGVGYYLSKANKLIETQTGMFWYGMAKYLEDIREMDQKIGALHSFLNDNERATGDLFQYTRNDESTGDTKVFNDMLLRFLLYDRKKLEENFCAHVQSPPMSFAQRFTMAMRRLFSMNASPWDKEEPLWSAARRATVHQAIEIVPALIQALDSHLKIAPVIGIGDVTGEDALDLVINRIDIILGEKRDSPSIDAPPLSHAQSNSNFIGACLKRLSQLAQYDEISGQIIQQDGLPLLMKLRQVAPEEKQQIERIFVNLLKNPVAHKSIPEDQLLMLIQQSVEQLREDPHEEVFLANVLCALGESYHATKSAPNRVRKFCSAIATRLMPRDLRDWTEKESMNLDSRHILSQRPYLAYHIHALLAKNQSLLTNPILLNASQHEDFLEQKSLFCKSRKIPTALVGSVALAAFASWWIRVRSNPHTIIYVIKKRQRLAALFMFTYFFLDNRSEIHSVVSGTFAMQRWMLERYLYSFTRLDLVQVYALIKLFMLLSVFGYAPQVLGPILVGYGVGSIGRRLKRNDL